VRIVYVETRARLEGFEDGAPEGSSFGKRRAFPRPTDSTDEVWRAARELLDELPRRRALVKRLGVVLHELTPASGWQGRLFDERADRQRRLDTALDGLRERLGFGRVLRGTSAPLAATHPLRPDGYRLRTPSLNQ